MLPRLLGCSGHPIIKEQYTLTSFAHQSFRGLPTALKKYLPHLCSQNEGGNRHWVSDCFQWCSGNADFSKELRFTLGHVDAWLVFFMSPGSSAHSTFYVSRVRLFYWEGCKNRGEWKGKCSESVWYCTLSVLPTEFVWGTLSPKRGTNCREFSKKQQILGLERKNSDKIFDCFRSPVYHC